MATAKRLSEIADQLRVAGTWVAGPRTVLLEELADELDPKVEVVAEEVVDKDLDTTHS